MIRLKATLIQILASASLFAMSVSFASDMTGEELYTLYCAACHGQSGEGDPRWPDVNDAGDMTAPPHDQRGHTWRHSTDDLIHMTLNGHRDPYNTTDVLTMPAFQGIIDEQDTLKIISYIQGWWTSKQIEYQSELE